MCCDVVDYISMQYKKSLEIMENFILYSKIEFYTLVLSK